MTVRKVKKIISWLFLDSISLSIVETPEKKGGKEFFIRQGNGQNNTHKLERTVIQILQTQQYQPKKHDVRHSIYRDTSREFSGAQK